MFKLEIDFKELIQLKDELAAIESARMANLTYSATNAIVLIRYRIRRGANADGEAMHSKSKFTEGAYSKMHARARKAARKQIDHVDLDFTGRTLANFKRINGRSAFREDSVDLGFDDAYSQKIALKNNAMFGPAYDISDLEVDQTWKDYLTEFNSELLK